METVMTSQRANHEAVASSRLGPIAMCSSQDGQQPVADSGPGLRPLEPMALTDHADVLYRPARALWGPRHEGEHLVQAIFGRVLGRPQLLRSANEVGYLLRA